MKPTGAESEERYCAITRGSNSLSLLAFSTLFEVAIVFALQMPTKNVKKKRKERETTVLCPESFWTVEANIFNSFSEFTIIKLSATTFNWQIWLKLMKKN